ncbi:hypothetical protein ABLO27_14900 [Roseibium sp. SCPC15]|uniref:hypothetical protein n=1 Tax=Roseibium sp. SCP15 TaxID=3141376 RepID=UPI00333A6B0D
MIERKLVSFELFRQLVKWLEANEALIAEMDEYKRNPLDWSRQKTRRICFKVEFEARRYLDVAKRFQESNIDKDKFAIALGVVAYDYIHSDGQITHQKTMRRGFKRLKSSQ